MLLLCQFGGRKEYGDTILGGYYYDCYFAIVGDKEYQLLKTNRHPISEIGNAYHVSWDNKNIFVVDNPRAVRYKAIVDTPQAAEQEGVIDSLPKVLLFPSGISLNLLFYDANGNEL